MSWEIPTLFWGRTAGFPATSASLASTEVGALATTASRLADELAAIEADLVGMLREAGGSLERTQLRLARRLRRLIRAGRPVPAEVALGPALDAARWATLVSERRTRGEALGAAAAECLAKLGRARQRERLVLREALGSARARDAALLNSRGMADAFAHDLTQTLPPATRPATLLERRALLFLQRLLWKPSMMGDYGPCLWGKLDAAQAAAIAIEVGPAQVKARRVFLEHWAIQVLARRIQADPAIRPHCRTRLNAGCLLEGRTLYYPVGHRIHIEPHEAEVLTWCIEGKSIGEIDALVAARPADEGQRLAHALSNYLTSKIASCDIDIPTADHHPERFLRAFLTSLDEACPSKGAWLDVLGALEALRDDLAHCQPVRDRRAIEDRLEARFTAATGEVARRNPGQVHGARFVTYEDCSRDVSLTLGQPITRALAELSPLFDLATWAVRAAAQRYEDKLRAVHARMAHGLDSVDFIAFVRETQWINESPEIVVGLARQLGEAWEQHLGELPPADRPLAVTPEDLRQVLALLEPIDADEGPWLPAADVHSARVLVAAAGAEAIARGQYTLVLDELFKGVPMWVHPAALPLSPAPDEVVGSFAGWLREPLLQLVDSPGSCHRSNINLPAVPNYFEATTVGAASRLAADHVIPCAELEVRNDGGHLCVASHDGRVEVGFFAVRWAFLQRKLLGLSLLPPRHEAAHAGRVSMGSWVLSRERWTFETAELLAAWAAAPAPEVGVAAWRARQGLPDHVFVKAKNQPRSVALDLRSVLHADLLRSLARRNDELTFTEMLPAPDQVFLPDRDGARYVSELRFSALQLPRPGTPTIEDLEA